MFGELEDGALAPNTPATPINYTGCFEVQCGVLGVGVVYWGLVWCTGGWCGVLGVGVVYWGLVWCTGVGVVYWGLVWCIGSSVVYEGWCGVLGPSVVCGVQWKLWNSAYNSSMTPMLTACSEGHCVAQWKECASHVGPTIVLVTHAQYVESSKFTCEWG